MKKLTLEARLVLAAAALIALVMFVPVACKPEGPGGPPVVTPKPTVTAGCEIPCGLTPAELHTHGWKIMGPAPSDGGASGTIFQGPDGQVVICRVDGSCETK